MKNTCLFILSILFSFNGFSQATTNCPTLTSAPAFIICGRPSVNIFAILSSSPFQVRYMWQAPLGASVSGLNTANITVNGIGVYTVVATNTVLNCSDEMTYTVTGCVGIGEKTADDHLVSVFPNPGTGNFTISVSEAVKVMLYNSSGALIQAVNYAEGQYNMDLSDKPAGLYILIVESGGAKKILKVCKAG